MSLPGKAEEYEIRTSGPAYGRYDVPQSAAPFIEKARVRGLYERGELVAVAILAVGPTHHDDPAESHRLYLEASAERCARLGIRLVGDWVQLGKSKFRRLAPTSWAADGSLVCEVAP